MEIAGICAVLLFLGLFSRFVWLQIAQFERFHALAESNRISLVPAAPSRGVIYDRQSTVLAHNFSASTLEITPSKAGKLDDTVNRLAEIVAIETSDRKRFKKLLAESKNFESIPIRNLLTEEEAARFSVNRYRFPGVEIKARQFRQYPLGAGFSHVVGYIGRIGEKDQQRLIDEGLDTNYKGTDHIGKLGIEARYEAWLHGRTGIEKVETDSGGRAVRVLSRTAPIAGHNIYLHLDAKLQQVAEEVFGDYRGALVALDPRNGGVLTLVSKPGFDPNLFVDGIDSATWHELNTSPDRPLVNRALRGVYPPGSTIKPFMGLAGVELGVRTPSYTISDPGYFALSGSSHRYRDWKKDGHGMVDLKRSITISCDTYYYGLAHQMGIERMAGFLSHFGFGRKTGIDLDGELSGLLPTPEWKKRRFKQPWWPGETVVAGIGQGYVLTTPMQLAVATMAIANDGIVYKPQLIRAWRDAATGKMGYAAPQAMERIKLTPAFLRLVKEAMVDVTRPGGTASIAGANTPYLFAGKTGTAQVVGIKQGAKYVESQVSARNRDHALFIAFAPADNPKIVVAVMVENGGHGGSTAAPIARKVIDYWLLGKLPKVLAPAEPEATPAPDEVEDHGPVEEPHSADTAITEVIPQ
ncbi:MAG: penicillin-binding protein 2 [Hydrogenophilales bacterium 28-61-23]|nr:MAG: penicillin-binding protein 2 [Hydrogenophilales bacterium 28-61-23]